MNSFQIKNHTLISFTFDNYRVDQEVLIFMSQQWTIQETMAQVASKVTH